MLRDKVAVWLETKNNITNVQPVEITIADDRWQGAVYIISGEKRYYLLGTRPVQKCPTCYKLMDMDFRSLTPHQCDWYIGAYIEWKDDRPLADWKIHPFGNHWLLVPWIIPGEPDSKIDDHEDEKYYRSYIEIKVF